MNQYESMAMLTRGGVHYFILTLKGGQSIHVYDSDCHFYGGYFRVEEFEKYLSKSGREALKLT